MIAFIRVQMTFSHIVHRGLIHHVGDIAIEAFTCLLIFKNIFSFGIALKAFDWLLASGIRKIFMVIASIQVVICLLTIPMCM